MKVAGARVLRYRVPFRHPYVTARGTATVREGFLVELRTTDGVTGVGEATLVPDAAADIEAFATEVGALAASSVGRAVQDILGGSGADKAGAAVEIAAWDLLARLSGVPLARLLAPGAADDVAVNALVTASAPEAVYAHASAARSAGFATIKLKVGVSSSGKDEVERVMAARSAIGPDAKLRLDANGAWSEDVAFHVIKNFAPYDIDYLEQPIPPGDLPALRRLRDSTRVPIAADEDVADPESAMRIIEQGAADVLVLKPLQLGGIGPSRQIAEAAVSSGVRVTFTTSIDSGVGTAAALHLAAASGGEAAAGLSTLPLLESSLIREDLAVEAGRMALPQGSGLGVTLDAEALRVYCITTRDY